MNGNNIAQLILTKNPEKAMEHTAAIRIYYRIYYPKLVFYSITLTLMLSDFSEWENIFQRAKPIWYHTTHR